MGRTVFLGATLVDGTGAPPLADAAVLVDAGRIAWVGAASAFDASPDVPRVQVRDTWLIPGLLDANVHLVFHLEPDVLFRFDMGRWDDLVLEAAQVALKAGVTTVFDTWGPLESLRRVRDRIASGAAVGSRIYCAGNIIGNDGPWSADFLPSFVPALNTAVLAEVNGHWEQGVGGDLPWLAAEDVRERVREYIATKEIDFVKYASSAHGAGQFLALSPAAQAAIVEEAHSAGLTAQACAMAPEPLRAAIGAGVDFLQHGDLTGRHPMPENTLRLIVDRQLPCIAPLSTQRYVDAVREQRTYGEDWARLIEVKHENDRRLIEAGARLMLASDSGLFGPNIGTSTFWGSYLTEIPDAWTLADAHPIWFRAARDHGLDPLEALLAATRNVAAAYGKAGELGTIEVGKRADLVFLDGNPLADVSSYERVVRVVKDGALVDRDRLPERPVLTSG
jgi:imidazolonepropionase-like amidohydrolase